MKNLLNNIAIRTKVIGVAVFLLTLLLFSSGYALYAMNQVGSELESIAEQDIPLTEALTAITEHQLEQGIHFERAMRYGLLLKSEKNAAAHLAKEIDSFDKLGKKIGEEIQRSELMAEENMAHAHSEADREEFDAVERALKNIETEHVDFEQHAHQVFGLLAKGKLHEAEALTEKVEIEEDRMNAELVALLAEVGSFTEAAGKRAEQHEQSAIKFMSLIMAVSLILGVVFSWVASANIIKRLVDFANSLETIAGGDLTHTITVEGNDEIGKLMQSMQVMQDRLSGMVSSILSTSLQLSTASEEVSAVMTQTAVNVQNQQTETEQIAHAMTEMSQAVADVSKNVEETSNASNHANAETLNGQKIVQETIDEIEKLANQIDGSTVVITQLEQSSEEINSVLDVIKDIAEQTNLLALNAAIEAARAGEQGRGFAVVADEVRTLAGRTQESTSEINAIIEKLQSGARKATQAMAESRERSHSVVDTASLAGSSLNSIAGSVERIDVMSTQIATATEEQNAVAKNLDDNISHINQIAMQNASSIEQTTVAGQELANVAAELKTLVEQFKVA